MLPAPAKAVLADLIVVICQRAARPVAVQVELGAPSAGEPVISLAQVVADVGAGQKITGEAVA